LLGEATDGRTYAIISATCQNLQRKVIRFETPGKQKGFELYNLFARVAYLPDEGIIEAEIHPKLLPHYLGLNRNFAEYNLFEFLKLPSTYSQRIFEILKSWDDEPCKEIDLEDLYRMLDVPASMRRYPDFRRKILDRAQRDIACTSLRYQWEPVKRGRAVVAIRFVFTKKGVVAVTAKKATKKAQNDSAAKNKALLAAVKCHAASKGRCTPKDNLQCQVCAQLVQTGKKA
jgi:plasmid replication initiation protein